MTAVTVLRHKFVRGWPRQAAGEGCMVLDLGEALSREYSEDAHFAAYYSPNGRRLTREAIDELGRVELTCIVFDVDGPDHAADERWRRETRDKVQALAAEHPGLFYYETRGGARIVYRQEEPTVLRSQADANEWSRAYAIAIAHLERRFGIAADPACNDWQRLYRLPHATRDEGKSPENWPIWGNPRSIGTLLLDAEPADVRRAQATSRASFNSSHEAVRAE
ncbi:MAG: hypothetical protein QM756_10620 [Polyangiaceae bacterium]